ncbi:FUSC family protein [Actinoalloteichus hymeniacidonis]|uniref:Fusaric acid resistance protein n=1 Tax=Actinoalloteichus hymeniacidonis TaxID=340345 RepID=A0AAC9HKX6_9PSEU|nr:FUSC family protein [Actinoalloteichus hymeniacidonis]AOS61252.1 hypothetical protein TL08_02070 [Actinoalloteichus hymeniacidonis]MBB5910745.1 MFS family permease [Actinoalloteichus hymeniacidonis]
MRQIVGTGVVVVLAAIFALLLGLGGAAIAGGLVAVLGLVSASGGPLRADLRTLSWAGPAIVLIMAVGPLLDGPTAVLAVFLVVFGSGMLATLGRHYAVIGQTLAAATLVALTGGVSAQDGPMVLIGTGLVGLVLAVALRISNGRDDPSGPTRAIVAAALTDHEPGSLDYATRVWRSDGSPEWLGTILVGTAEYRAARAMLAVQAAQAEGVESERLTAILSDAESVAAELADAVRARACTGLPAMAKMDPAGRASRVYGDVELPESVDTIRVGLDRIRGAVVERVATRAPRRPNRAAVHRALGVLLAHLSFRSSLFRHALRCSLAVTAGMVAVLWLPDGSAAPLLLVLYAVLQPMLRDTMEEALQRTGLVVFVVAVIAVVAALLPWPGVLLPFVLGAMILLAPRMRGSLPLLLCCLLGLIVVARVIQEDRAVSALALNITAISAIGATIALLVGFLSYLVPGSVAPDVLGTLHKAVYAVRDLAAGAHGALETREGRRALRSANILALRRSQDLLALPARLEEAGPEAQQVVRRAASAVFALRAALAQIAFRPDEERGRALIAAVTAQRALDYESRQPTRVDLSSLAGPTLLVAPVLEATLVARSAIEEVRAVDWTEPSAFGAVDGVTLSSVSDRQETVDADSVPDSAAPVGED